MIRQLNDLLETYEDSPHDKVVEMAENRNSGSGGGEKTMPFSKASTLLSDSKANIANKGSNKGLFNVSHLASALSR